MAEISKDLQKLYDSNFKKIPCLNKDGCDFHRFVTLKNYPHDSKKLV